MITPIGANVEMTAASVNAGISAYSQSTYYDRKGLPVTMASVPDDIFLRSEAQIDEGSWYSDMHDRIIKMAIIAANEACTAKEPRQSAPLILTMPDMIPGVDYIDASSLINNLVANCPPWIDRQQCRTICSGRAAGLEALDFVFDYLIDGPGDFYIVGGSDSHRNYSRLRELGNSDRLAVEGSSNGFVPGEAAGFLLVTRHPGLALVCNGRRVVLHPPGIAEEPGHLYSEQPYLGEGLDHAFKKAMANSPGINVSKIIGSMNGENHWAREYGVASLRNSAFFQETLQLEHPAEYFGDLGSATAPVFIALAAQQLFKGNQFGHHLVYSSSDTATRGAILVESIPATV